MAHIVMAHIGMAHIGMAHIVMALNSYGAGGTLLVGGTLWAVPRREVRR